MRLGAGEIALGVVGILGFMAWRNGAFAGQTSVFDVPYAHGITAGDVQVGAMSGYRQHTDGNWYAEGHAGDPLYQALPEYSGRVDPLTGGELARAWV